MGHTWDASNRPIPTAESEWTEWKRTWSTRVATKAMGVPVNPCKTGSKRSRGFWRYIGIELTDLFVRFFLCAVWSHMVAPTRKTVFFYFFGRRLLGKCSNSEDEESLLQKEKGISTLMD